MSEFWTHAKDWVPVAMLLVSGGIAYQKLRGGLKKLGGGLKHVKERTAKVEEYLDEIRTDGQFVRPGECAALHKGLNEKLDMIYGQVQSTNKLILQHIQNGGGRGSHSQD
jgi:hypothetical protein